MKIIKYLYYYFEYNFKCRNELIVRNTRENTILRLQTAYSGKVGENDLIAFKVYRNISEFENSSSKYSKNHVSVFLFPNTETVLNVYEKYRNFLLDPSIIGCLCDDFSYKMFAELNPGTTGVSPTYDVDRKQEKSQYFYIIPLIFNIIDSLQLRIEIHKHYPFSDIFSILFSISIIILGYHVCLQIIMMVATIEPDYKKFTFVGSEYIDFRNLPDDATSCLICYMDFDDEEKIRKLPCSHYFHVECVDKWIIGRNPICPLCRRSVPISD